MQTWDMNNCCHLFIIVVIVNISSHSFVCKHCDSWVSVAHQGMWGVWRQGSDQEDWRVAFTSASVDRKTSILVKISRDLLTPLILLGKWLLHHKVNPSPHLSPFSSLNTDNVNKAHREQVHRNSHKLNWAWVANRQIQMSSTWNYEIRIKKWNIQKQK